MNLWPEPTSASATNNFVYAPVKTQDDDSFDIRLDHRFNTENALFARYSYNNARTFFPDSLPPVNGITPGGLGNTVFPGTSKQKPQAIQLNFDRVFSPKFIMEIKGGFSRYDAATNHSNFGINASEQMGIPGINIDDDSSGLSRIIVAPFVDLGDAGFIPLVIVNDLIQGACEHDLRLRRQHAQGGHRPQEPRSARVAESDSARHLHVQRQLHVQRGRDWNGRPVRVVPAGPAVEHGAVEVPRQAVLSDEGSRHVRPGTTAVRPTG